MLCARLAQNSIFNNTILFFILASTVTLALDTPLENPEGKLMKVLGKIDYCMTGVFTFEALVKIIAFGFVVNKQSYLRNPWNIMDFFVVASALLSIALADVSFLSVIKIVRVVRIVRVLRPLRVVSKYRGLQIAITCLVKSIPGVLQLQVIVIFALMLLSVLHTMLFSGKLFTCNTSKLKWSKHPISELMKDKWDCVNYGGEWVRQDFNFDNFWASFLTLFTIQTQENWVPVMWSEVDAVAPQTMPATDHNKALSLLSIVSIILTSTLFLNLFVGVVIETFSKQKEIISKDYMLQKFQRNWITISLMIYRASPVFVKPESKTACRRVIRRLVEHSAFEMFIMVCIVVNTAVLCISWYGMSKQTKDLTTLFNYVLIGIFTMEFVLKTIAYDRHYFFDNWNRFDFFVVMLTLIVLLAESLKVSSIGRATSILRSMRILRVLRLVKRFKRL